jgi:hypothetical protein
LAAYLIWPNDGPPCRSARQKPTTDDTPRRASTEVAARPAALADVPGRVATKNVEDVAVGDRVVAWDEAAGRTVVRPVVRTFQNRSDHLRRVRVLGSDGTSQEIETTNEHPFWVPEAGWVPAGALKPGMKLVQSDGQSAVVESTHLTPSSRGAPVYNFEVSGAHTYYVAAHAARGPPILVHNMCAKAAAKKAAKEQAKEGAGKASKRALSGVAGPDDIIWGKNFAKKARKHINQVRHRASIPDDIPKLNQGGLDKLK